ncbi:MAG: hypothetical protein KC964_28980 [Candidatus Omnitrophica bacterium]|nr:hypothetical protein [Candidatus Omnitrophota bacterium]
MKTLIAVAEPDPNSEFEQRRMRRINEVFSRVERALNGEPAARMTLDEEATVVDFKARNLQGAVDRLKPWVLQYPLESYSLWNDSELKEKVVWVHHVFGCALSYLGRLDESEAAFQSIIDNVPEEENPGGVARALVWRGHVLNKEGRLIDAIESFEQGLAVDAVNTPLDLPGDFDQPSVKGSQMGRRLRSDFVDIYEQAKIRYTVNGGGAAQ